jgi:hypothetical protein
VLDDSDYLLGRYFGDVALAGQARISDIRQPLSHSSGIFIASQDRLPKLRPRHADLAIPRAICLRTLSVMPSGLPP